MKLPKVISHTRVVLELFKGICHKMCMFYVNELIKSLALFLGLFRKVFLNKNPHTKRFNNFELCELSVSEANIFYIYIYLYILDRMNAVSIILNDLTNKYRTGKCKKYLQV